MVVIAALFVTTMFVVLSTLSLSGKQVADRDLGRFGAAVGYGTVALSPGDERAVDAFAAAAADSGASDAMVMITATNVPLDGAAVSEITFIQADWRTDPFPERYSLLSGSWPTRPGEVVVTDPDALDDVPVGATLDGPGGAVFRVVGTAEDHFARQASVMAAPGTWSTFDPALAEQFPVLRAQPVLMWQGNGIDAVSSALSEVASTASGPRIDMHSTLIIRDEVGESGSERTWINRIPAGYTIPSVGLALLSSLFFVFVNERVFRNNRATLVSLGVRPLTAETAFFVATSTWCLLGAAVGSALGIGLGALSRVAISSVREVLPGPIEDLHRPLATFLGMSLVGALSGCVLLALRARRAGTDTQRSTGARDAVRGQQRHLLLHGRRLVVLGAGWGALLFSFRVDTPARAMILGALLAVAVLLALPDVVRTVIARLPRRGPRSRLAWRQLQAESGRAIAATALIAAVLGLCVGVLSLVSSMVSTIEAGNAPPVLPGQLLVGDRVSIAVPPSHAVLAAVEASVGAQKESDFQLQYVFRMDDEGNLESSVTRGVSDATILAVDTIADVEALAGTELIGAPEDVLRAGGLLVWADSPAAPAPAGADVALSLVEGNSVQQGPTVPSATIDAPPAGWRLGTDGVMLSSSAEEWGLPLTTGPTMFTGLDEQAGVAAADAVAAAGLDPRTVQHYVPPAPVLPAAGYVATAVGLVVLTVLTGLAATGAQVRSLRSYLSQLVGLGIAPAWARQVLGYQQLFIVVTGTAAGLLIAVPPVVFIASTSPGWALAIPWGQIAGLLVLVYGAILVTVVRSMRSLTARDPA